MKQIHVIQLLLIVSLLPKSFYYVQAFISLNKLFAHVTSVFTILLYWNITPNSLSSLHCGMLCILHISSTNPFLRKVNSLHFLGLHEIEFSTDQHEKLSTTFGDWSTSFPFLSSAYLKSIIWLYMYVN